MSAMLDRLGRTRVMGVLNVTPDSFSDGGTFLDTAAAIKAGEQMLEDGADVLDVGGESTRPGAAQISVQVELERVLPVVKALAGKAVVSIDTTKAEVAKACIDAGAQIVNDVSCARYPALLDVAARAGVTYVLMHNRAPSVEMQSRAEYVDVRSEVAAELAAALDNVRAAGIESIAIDPGLGFAKRAEHNWELLRYLRDFDAFELPLLVGASRKSFLGSLLPEPDGSPRPVHRREAATQAITTFAALHHAWAVRVHDVGPAVDACRVVERLEGTWTPSR